MLDLLALCNCLDTATQKWQQALSAAVATAAQPFHLFVCVLEYQGRKRKKNEQEIRGCSQDKDIVSSCTNPPKLNAVMCTLAETCAHVLFMATYAVNSFKCMSHTMHDIKNLYTSVSKP